ncbi:LAETG motif-containing sortase-dependent surface protein [Streptomyces phaeoluteigriseus]|uniref:LAETG motif-containing sortase-dependent surface protein n=1 Tax=Streptomyces phaeoluteigriseus TaxID=114686 RepID=UPI0036B75688
MSPSRRTAARSVRMFGLVSASAALVLGISGTALATDPLGIGQFSAAASCDGSKGVITVTSTDATATPAVVTVFLQNNNADLRRIGEPTPVKGSAEGVAVTFAENWAPGAKYRVHIKSGNDLDADIPILEAPAKACTGADDTPTTPSASSTPSTTPSGTASTPAAAPGEPTRSAAESDSTVPAASASNAPSPAAQESNLAETGASSRTGLIVGIAAVLVVVGGGAVFFGMRRKGTGNR